MNTKKSSLIIRTLLLALTVAFTFLMFSCDEDHPEPIPVEVVEKYRKYESEPIGQIVTNINYEENAGECLGDCYKAVLIDSVNTLLIIESDTSVWLTENWIYMINFDIQSFQEMQDVPSRCPDCPYGVVTIATDSITHSASFPLTARLELSVLDSLQSYF